MIKISRFLWLLFLCLPTFIKAQTGQPSEGILWANNLTWDQIKLKAKQENKYIFLDCYATWCMPCKKMDKEIYPNDSIYNFLNSSFIAVKLQMDTAKNDDEVTKKWYAGAQYISQLYKINSYPTFLFFSPSGELVHKGEGYKDVQQFLSFTRDVLNPDKQFYTQLKNYRTGKKDYSKMPDLAYQAYNLESESTSRMIAKDYIDNYLFHLKSSELYTKENIQFIRAFTTQSRDKGFWILYKNAGRINKLMEDSNYVEPLLHYVISKEEVDSPLLVTAKNPTGIPGWEKIKRTILRKYNSYYADRIIIDAKSRWYKSKKDWPQFSKYTVDFVEKYVPHSNDFELADKSWDIFLVSMNKKELEAALKWTKYIIQRSTDSTNMLPNTMDTYANLIYKISYQFKDNKETQLAIEEERKALSLALRFNDKYKIKSFSKTIEKMKNGESTWDFLKQTSSN